MKTVALGAWAATLERSGSRGGRAVLEAALRIVGCEEHSSP